MRYFLVTFNPNNILAFGMITIECEDFFSYNQLLEEIQKNKPAVDGVVIMNIHEFDNKHDYMAYKKENG